MITNKKTIFLFSGEGTRGPETDIRLLKYSSLWLQIKDMLESKLDLDVEEIWNLQSDLHARPSSPLITLITQVCLSDLWSTFGYKPDVIVGHSTGELSAAYLAGLYSLEEVVQIAHSIGKTAANLKGAMAHGWLTEPEVSSFENNISSFNFTGKKGTHVTVSGNIDSINRLIEKDDRFVKMNLPHPWHHPDYKPFLESIRSMPSKTITKGVFVSGISTKFETSLPDYHWRQWMVKPVNFINSMQTIKDFYPDTEFQIIEIGFHPILTESCHIFSKYQLVSSMFRGEDSFKWMYFQRSKLDQRKLIEKISTCLDEVKPGIDFNESLAYQGLTSIEFTKLAGLLQPLFPSLAPQDFFRFKTINQLVKGFGIEKADSTPKNRRQRDDKVVIVGISCRFPSSVETPSQFWQILSNGEDQVRKDRERSLLEAGFLSKTTSRFDHAYFKIPHAEAQTMDPQQILALELTEMLWQDAGIDPKNIERKRVGVYLGVWNQEYGGDKNSVFYPSGVNPSIISARISYHYDLRGPNMVFNTACSSSLLAVHYAAKDIEAGRIDYAIAGGVNMLLDESFSQSMNNSGFLSNDNRCKAFDDSANGYVRSEGGGLVLLASPSVVSKCYAILEGSAVNQNGGRSQVITAPHPEAQEELILEACNEAGIKPEKISYIETHGTGTKIGDPIEISALENTVGKNRVMPCYIGSVKTNIGHLESAAGVAGLIKAILILQNEEIPPNLHFKVPNKFINFDAGNIKVVTQTTSIDHQAYIGISSFGFGGSNAHVIIKGVEKDLLKQVSNITSPFNRESSSELADYLRTIVDDQPEQKEADAIKGKVTDIPELITSLIFEITGIEEMEPDVELLDQGLDSLGATELLSQLMENFDIEIEPEILFEYPLPDQFIQRICELAEKKI